MKRKLLVALLAAVSLTACGGGAAVSSTDPRTDWVEVDSGVWKKCDGTTLIYEIGRAGTTVANSPECAAK